MIELDVIGLIVMFVVLVAIIYIQIYVWLLPIILGGLLHLLKSP